MSVLYLSYFFGDSVVSDALSCKVSAVHTPTAILQCTAEFALYYRDFHPHTCSITVNISPTPQYYNNPHPHVTLYYTLFIYNIICR